MTPPIPGDPPEDTGPRSEEQLDYWTRQLAGAPLLLELPADRPRPAVQSGLTARHDFAFPPALGPALFELGRREGATLGSALLAGFAALLYRYSGQEDLLVGFGANTLVVRVQLRGELPFRTLLAQAHQRANEAFAHQDLPFDEILSGLGLRRDPGFSPLVQVALDVQAQSPESASSSMRAHAAEHGSDRGTGASNLDLTLSILAAGDQLGGTLEYSTDLFDSATVERMAEHFRVLLEGAVAAPHLVIGDLPLITDAERQKIVEEWGRPKSQTDPPPCCLHELFEASARRSPDSTALTSGDRQLTYRELRERVEPLARLLTAQGVGPEVLVGICMERSPELIIALLAVLKAGGAYVPLDPDYPRDRLAFIVGDARVGLVLASRESFPSAAQLTGESVRVLLVESGGNQIDSAIATPPCDSPATPSNAAYVIYTSGSTGKPKGVVVTHANVSRLLARTAGLFEFGGTDVWTLFHSFAFDFSVWEIWGALAFGGRLVIVPHPISRSPAEFLTLLRREGVTVLNQTPSAFSGLVEIVENMPQAELPDLRLVIFGGEALDFHSLRPWANRLGLDRPALVNMYGITETTVHVTHYRILERDMGSTRSMIGRPIEDLSTYILDRRMQPMPVGIPGELYVGGAGVARGYLHRPELTAQRFVADPLATEPGVRLYRTGDLARYLPDGNIEYLGRIDQQVKIRGFRIELGEIEAALASHPAVRESRVIAREDVPGDKRLVGYVVAVAGTDPANAAELRQHLSTQLPDYMVPSAFVWLDALPLTPNGKLDRGGLPEPRLGDPHASGESAGNQAPRTPEEECLAGIARKLLNYPALGCEEDLFDLGMHSLLAGRMAAAIRQRFGAATGIKDIFETRTVRALGGRVAAQHATGTGAEEAIPRAGHRDNIPLTWQQEQIWFLAKLAPESQAYNSQFTLRLRGRLDRDALLGSLSRIVERHEILRTTFHDGPSGPVQTVHPPWEAQAELLDFSQLDPEDREPAAEQAVNQAIRHAFDPSALPLVKWTLCRLADDDHILLHVEHHLVHDGWEVAVLLRELQEFYSAAVEHRPPALEELPIQYADYALWQRAYLSGETLAAKVRYWEERVRDYPRVLNLPTDHERPPAQSFRGGALRADMDRGLYAALRNFSRQHKVTLFVTMYSAFALLLARYCAQKRLLIATGVANRSRREVEGLLGMFVNPVAMTTDLTGDPAFEELLAQTQRSMLEDAVHQDTPFTEVVRQLKAAHTRDRNPLVQVLFAFHDSAVPVPDFAGLQGTVAERHNGSAKMDMNIVCVPRAEQRVGQRGRQAGQEDFTLLWEYNSDLFEERTIERMLGHYLHLLREAIGAPGTRASEFDIVPAAERSRILREFNPPRVPYQRDRTVWDLFQEVAGRQPQKPAILAPGNSVSYAELAAGAGRVAAALARALQAKPQPPGFAVGLCVPRGAAMIAGMLGILRSGGAYVPIPPAYPEERIRLMLRDSNAAVVLAQGAGLTPPGGLGGLQCPVLDLDAILDSVKPAGDPPPCAQPNAESTAYIIYTSGSTGTPKGTVVPHRAIHNLALSLRRDLVGADDVVAQLADSAFDATIFEIWGTLLTGAAVAIVDPDAVTDPERLERVMAEYGVTAAFFTATLFNLISELRPGALASLRNAAVGGEKVNRRAIERVLMQAPGAVRVWNGYGPTECTCFSADFQFTLEQLKSGTLPIGKPLINYAAYVLDEKRNLVPIGVPGELYIGGDGLAAGYLQRPELTADRFVPNPFATADDREGNWNLRLYRTGDSVRWLEDGNLEFLGRLDDQVKVRGFRVELGEIEAALARHPAVSLAAATVREEPGGEKQVVAWVSAADGATARPEELRRFLQQTLPPYMIPGRFVILDRFPLTASGKIDRLSLSAPPGQAPAGDDEEVATPLTSQLTQIWEELLGVHPIRQHQDFFSLGGHSLLAVRMVNRLEKLIGRRIPVATLFSASTISQLARVLVACEPAAGPPPIQVQAGSRRPPLFFFDGDWLGGGLYCRNLARLLDEDLPFYTVPPHGADGGAVPPSVQAMAADRLDGLLAVQPEGPFLLCGYCAGGLIALEIARLLKAKRHVVGMLVLLDSVADQAGGIPWRRLHKRRRDLGLQLASFRRQWAERDLRGRMGLLGESIRRRLAPGETGTPAAAPESGTLDWTHGPLAAYMRSLSRYRLRPYSGRISLIFTRNSVWELNPELPWRKTVSNLEIRWVPGDHTTALAAHAAETAAAIRDALARASAGTIEPDAHIES